MRIPQLDFALHLHVLLALRQGHRIVELARDPRVLNDLGDAVSLLNRSAEKPYYERLGQLADLELVQVVLDDLVNAALRYAVDVRLLGVAVLVEWVPAREHLEEDDADGPHVDTLAVALPCGLLRRHEQYGSHHFEHVLTAVEDVGVHFCGESKICNLCCVSLGRRLRVRTIIEHSLVDEDVLRFEIAMNKVLVVELEQAFDDALRYRSSNFFVENNGQQSLRERRLTATRQVARTVARLVVVVDGLVERRLLNHFAATLFALSFLFARLDE